MAETRSRRSFFSRLTAGVAAFTAGSSLSEAETAPAVETAFRPARHPEDRWMDALPGKHRFFFDARSPRGLGEAIAFASNAFAGSKNGYDLGDADLALIVCLRHFATPFAYNDTIWKKYGAAMAGPIEFTDPKTKHAPTLNVYNTAGFDAALPNRNIPLEALAKRGVHFAICGLATRLQASLISRAHGQSVDDAFKEVSANLLPNGHLVPAGVVAVNRAQEYGYSYMYVG